MKSIAEVMPILKGIRQEKKITIKEVVEYLEQVANVSVAEKTVYGWENLSSKPDVMCFMALCNLYEIENIQDLFDDNTEYVRRKPTLRDGLYNAYVVAGNDVQNAVRILLDIEEKES